MQQICVIWETVCATADGNWIMMKKFPHEGVSSSIFLLLQHTLGRVSHLACYSPILLLPFTSHIEFVYLPVLLCKHSVRLGGDFIPLHYSQHCTSLPIHCTLPLTIPIPFPLTHHVTILKECYNILCCCNLLGNWATRIKTLVVGFTFSFFLKKTGRKRQRFVSWPSRQARVANAVREVVHFSFTAGIRHDIKWTGHPHLDIVNVKEGWKWHRVVLVMWFSGYISWSSGISLSLQPFSSQLITYRCYVMPSLLLIQTHEVPKYWHPDAQQAPWRLWQTCNGLRVLSWCARSTYVTLVTSGPPSVFQWMCRMS